MLMDLKDDPLAYKSIRGLEHIDKVIEIDQSPIGTTPQEQSCNLLRILHRYTNIICFYSRSQDPWIQCGAIFIQCQKRAV